MRHGESQWNLENRFTGWCDVDLTETGLKQAQAAGELLKAEGFHFDIAFTSVLKRAIRTLWTALDNMDQMYVPVHRHWRLNERHYGSLQGLDKAETAAKYGDEQVHIWRRSYDTPPPLVDEKHQYFPGNDRRYAQLDPKAFPCGESLKDTIARVLPYWHDAIVPEIRAGKNVVIAAHGNSLRALVQYLDKLDEKTVLALNIPTAVPLVYELDKDLSPIKSGYLGDAEEIKKMMAAVANQGKAKK